MTGADNLCQAEEKTSWRGQWIWVNDSGTARNAYAFFRRSFRLPSAQTVRIAITADTFYELHVDGRRIGRGPSRAHLDYYSFDRHNLSLPSGDHVLAVLVHHIGIIHGARMTGHPGLLVDVDLADEGFGSDPTWRCEVAEAWRPDVAALMSHYGFWEECDLARLPGGWAALGCDDAAWRPAIVIGQPPCPPWRRLIEPDIPLPRETNIAIRGLHAAGAWVQGPVLEDDDAKRRVTAQGYIEGGSTLDIPSKQAAARCRTTSQPPASLPATFAVAEGPDRGAWLTLDFGRTVSGYVVLDIDARHSGTCVDLSYDDVTTPNGVVNPERTYARMTDRFLLAQGVNMVRPVHPRGFRYVTVDMKGSGPVTMRRAWAVEETYPFEDAGDFFRCSDPELTGFAARAAETVRVCSTDAFTDCASRERVQWIEDLYLHARVAAYAFGDTRLLRRALFHGAQNALPDGRINGFVPSERTNCAFASSSIMWLHLLADYRLYAGDESGCLQLLPSAHRLLDFLRGRVDAQGLIPSWPDPQFWDWSPVERKGCLLLTNAAYVWALSRLAQDDLWRRSLGGDLEAQADRVRGAAQEQFWDAGRGLYRDGQASADRTPIFSQHANALATLSGICPVARREALLRQIVDPANLGPVPVGEHSLNNTNRPDPDRIVPVGTLWFGHFLCQALFEAGLVREALAQMRLLWGPYSDSATFPETRLPAGNTTQCHGWAGGPAFLLPAYVLGVRPTGPGWSRIAVAQRACGLVTASAIIRTPLGPLTIHRREEAGRVALDVAAPAGMQVDSTG
jgi:hypothetical protein